MPYKDKVKQQQYQRDWVRQKRVRQGSTPIMPVGKTHTAKMGFEPQLIYRVDADGNRIYE
jgi:hypothetical protein